MKIKFVLTVLVAGFATTSAGAGVTGIPFSSTSTPLSGFVTNHVTANLSTKLLSTILYVPLTSGTFSNIAFNDPPLVNHIDEQFALVPGDSYWTINQDPRSRFSGGAIDLGGTFASPIFNDGGTTVEVSVFQPGPFVDHSGPGIILGDLTFSNNANGIGKLRIQTNPSTVDFDLVVANGVLTILPEPASLTLMSLAGLAVLRQHR